VRAPAQGADEGGKPAGVGDVLGLLIFLYVVTLLMQIAFYMVPVQLPFFLEQIGETSPSRVGVAIALMTVCSGSVAASFRWIRARLDRISILGASFGLMGSGYVILSTADHFAGAVISVMVFGLGLGLTFPNIIGWLLSDTPREIRGRVVGGMTTFAFSGQFLSPIAALPLIARFGIGGAFRLVGFAMITGAVVAAAAWAAGARRDSRDD
jgi:MFS family permease